MDSWYGKYNTLPADLDYEDGTEVGAIRRILAKPFLAPGTDYATLGLDLTALLELGSLEREERAKPVSLDGTEFRRLDPRVRIRHGLRWRALMASVPPAAMPLIANVLATLREPTEVAATTWALWALCNPQAGAVLQWLQSIDVGTLTRKSRAALFKAVHVLARKYRWVPTVGYASGAVTRLWQYMQDLDNRDLYQETFRDEMAVRTMGEPRQSSILPGPMGAYLDDAKHNAYIQNYIRELVTDTCRRHAPKTETLAQFWARRVEWSASGSAPGAKHWMDVNGRAESTSATKLSLAATLPDDFLEYTLQQPPSTLSKAVHKFENGKNRNLWNCTNGLYYLEAYLSDGFEKGLTGTAGMRITDGGTGALVGAAARVLAARQRKWILSYDFHDFNYYHLLRHQATMVREIGRVRATGGTSPQADYKRVGDFLAECRTHTVLADPSSDTIGVADTALVTGLRLTTVTNTIFNATYLELARHLLHIWGIEVETEIDDRLGDDVFSVGASWLPLAALSEMVNAIGYTGQGLKIELDRRGEFLRLEYDEHGISGYLNRTLPNLASGEWDLSAGGGVAERASSLWAQLEKMQRRGADIDVPTWWRCFVRPLCGSKVYGQTGAPPLTWLTAHSSMGGGNMATLARGVFSWSGMDFTQVDVPNIPIPGQLLDSLIGPGIKREAQRAAALTPEFTGNELRVINHDLVKTAFAKCWPAGLVNGWHALAGAEWLNAHGRRGHRVTRALVDIPDEIWMAALAQIGTMRECEATTLRGAWARLEPPVLLAVKLASKHKGGGLIGLRRLFAEQDIMDVVDILDRWAAHYPHEAITAWIFDDWQWPSVKDESLGEYGTSLVRECTDRILSMSAFEIPLDQETLETIWLSVWHKVYTLGTFVY